MKKLYIYRIELEHIAATAGYNTSYVATEDKQAKIVSASQIDANPDYKNICLHRRASYHPCGYIYKYLNGLKILKWNPAKKPTRFSAQTSPCKARIFSSSLIYVHNAFQKSIAICSTDIAKGTPCQYNMVLQKRHPRQTRSQNHNKRKSPERNLRIEALDWYGYYNGFTT